MNARANTRQMWMASVIFFSAAFAVTPLANAGDGVIEINQARASAGGVTGGDTPGWPVTISQPGSYRLTSNLERLERPSLATISHMVDVTADDVTIDLNGFRIRCYQFFLVIGGGSSTSPCKSQSDNNGAGAQGDGIHSVGRNLSVMNGTIWGMPDDGIEADTGTLVRNVRAISNRNVGIEVREGSLVTDSTASKNGGPGFDIAVGELSRSTSFRNQWGVITIAGTLLRDNHIYANTTYGIWGWTGSFLFGGNTIWGHGAGDINGTGVSIPPNSNSCGAGYC